MRTYTGQEEIDTRVASALNALGHRELVGKVWWMWNGRFTATIADALFPEMRIRLSMKAWPLMSTSSRRETIDHEVCHLIDAYLIGYMPGPDPHTETWAELMRQLGYSAVSDSIGVEGFDRIAACKKVRAYCGCEARYIPVQMAGRIRNGASFKCRFCGDLLFVMR